MRERGLKQFIDRRFDQVINVVPRAGTWIETVHTDRSPAVPEASFPVRERGLKRIQRRVHLIGMSVVPRAGTWIETLLL